MAVPLILCRLKDDHSVVQAVGETALVYFPDWEPIPIEHLKLIEEENNMPGPLPGPEPEKKTPAPRTRSKAAESAAKDKE